MAHKHANTLARRQAIQVLYKMEITGIKDAEVAVAQVIPDEGVTPSEYASRLVRGTMVFLPKIDDMIEEFAENWTIDRMPLVDKAILRTATYEMLCVHECPVSVAINEAVDLAKAFGCEDESARFINGVLGRIAENYAKPEDFEDQTKVAADQAEPAAQE